MSKPTGFRRSPCPIANSLELVGDKWTLLVIREAFLAWWGTLR